MNMPDTASNTVSRDDNERQSLRLNDSLDILQQAAAAFARRSQYIRFYTEPDTPLDRSAYLLLTYLRGHSPATMGTLASEFDVNPSTITRQVRSLAERGHVTVARANDGSNTTSVAITAEGVTDVMTVRAARVRIFSQLLADWNPDDIHDLADKLQRFVRVLVTDAGAARMAGVNSGHLLLDKSKH